MSRTKKNAQRFASGCKVCGNPDVGRGISKHLEGAHGGLRLADYKKCFNGGRVVVDKLVETGTAARGTQKVVLHVLVRKFLIPI